ncbi:MAG TPA: hypothetical protein VHT75_10520 [Acidimicrobiales bacterium]|jgi:hypothetical protein|nr:hypothetical protein [Acidimicrobiales bacterium]
MTKKIWPAAIVAALFVCLAGTATASAQTRSERIFIYDQGTLGGDQPTASLVTATGVVNAVGTDQFAPSQPGDPANLDRDIFVFPDGTLSVATTKVVNEVIPTGPCTVELKMSGTFQITGGTGAYQGAHGSGTFTQHGIGIGAPLPGGGCSHTQGTYYIWGTDRGTLDIP